MKTLTLRMKALRITLCAAGCVLGLLAAPAQSAEAWPARPVKIVVPYPAGGAIDPPARILARQLAAQTGQSFVVDNRPGAGSTIGADAVAGATPDGYTLLISGSNLAIAPALLGTVRFDPQTSFTPLAQIATVPAAIVVPASSRIRSMAELLAEARKRPGQLSYGSPGNGSPSHLSMELLKFRTGVDIRHIPYKGTAPALVDVLGGQVDLVISTLAGPLEHIRSARLRALGVTSATRVAELPEVAAIAETVPGFELTTWIGLLGPKGLPAEITARLEAEVAKALKDPATLRQLREVGVTPDYQDAAQVAQRLKTETGMYAQLITAARIKPD